MAPRRGRPGDWLGEQVWLSPVGSAWERGTEIREAVSYLSHPADGHRSCRSASRMVPRDSRLSPSASD